METYKITFGNSKGFTLLELTLVTIIIGILLAVVVPRALRANVEAKYAVVRQSASEVASWGMEWAQRNLDSQDVEATCNMDSYVATLAGYVGNNDNTNWINVNIDRADEQCRPPDDLITYSVSDIIDVENHPRNPFNGLSYFNTEGMNSGNELYSGLLYLGVYPDTEEAPQNVVNYYYFVYTGTDSQNTSQWHAGMGEGAEPDINNLKNGIYMARLVEILPP